MIWKLQRPITSSDGGRMNEIMAYTENRENMSMITLSEEQIDELFGDKYKIYVKATVVDGDLKVTKVVKDRDW